LIGNQYYHPSQQGVEPQIDKRLKDLWGKERKPDV